ncbi:MAG: ribonuclease III family protein [Candidatus Lokiarchaeota archaeon]|nr:ribonuclease III family protein [Candidatus Lokiarchaeota archaeon]
MAAPGLGELQARIGYAFKDEALLVEALTTPAYAKQHGVPSYERLEFLGDAVAKLIMAQALYDEPEKKDQEAMTKQRNILESNKVMATRAIELGIEGHVISLAPIGAGDAGVLSDVLEALCGAVYLDAGRNIAPVRDGLLGPIMAKAGSHIDASPDQQKNQFLEAVQRLFGITPAIEMEYVESGPDHAKRFGARRLRVLHPADGCVILDFPGLATSVAFKQKKEAEKELMRQAFDAWRTTDFKA